MKTTEIREFSGFLGFFDLAQNKNPDPESPIFIPGIEIFSWDEIFRQKATSCFILRKINRETKKLRKL